MKKAGGAQSGYSMVELLLVMLLLCMFALTVATLIQSGARAYDTIGGNMAREADARTALSYINVRVKQNDAQGALSVAQAMGGDALVIREEYNGVEYYTWIYHTDGALMEAPLLLEHELPTPSMSELIARVDGFDIAYDAERGTLDYNIYYVREAGGAAARLRMAGSSLLKAGDVSDWR